jgi:DNA-binding CsgD family transcriptional regulator
MQNQKLQIPPGMNAHEAEIFFDGDTLQIVFDKKIYPWAEMPSPVREMLKVELANDAPARKIMDDAGVNLLSDRLYIYAKCRFGGYNLTPDLHLMGIRSSSEQWDCGCNGNCCLAPLFRETMPAKNGILNKRHIQIIKLLGQGLQTKEIANILCTSIQTIDKAKQRIFHATETTNSLELANWAHAKNIALW